MYSGVTPIGQGWTNARGLRGLGGSKPECLTPQKICFNDKSLISLCAVYNTRCAVFARLIIFENLYSPANGSIKQGRNQIKS